MGRELVMSCEPSASVHRVVGGLAVGIPTPTTSDVVFWELEVAFEAWPIAGG